MTTNAHPICLLARTESDITTLFYCFYVISYEQGEYKVAVRIPEYRDQMLDTVQVFLPYNTKRFAFKDAFGASTITISDGTRYYAYWKGYKDRVFIGYSKIFFTSFARNVFELLSYEHPGELKSTLHCLCEMPIQPGCGLAYDLVMRGGAATLSFSSIEQADDEDMSLVAMRFLSPTMLVTCWEAIILERNVLVIGVDETIVSMCCEFLRKLVLPLNFCNIYIPQLLPELMEVVRESPIPYIIGVGVETLKIEGLKLENIDAIILDINTGTINSSTLYSKPYIIRAPTVLIDRLVKKVTATYNNPALSRWFNRTSSTNSQNLMNVFSTNMINEQADKVIGIFSSVNLSLLSARACSSKGLYRRPKVKINGSDVEFDHIPIRNRSSANQKSTRGDSRTGFTKNLDHMVGLMNLLRDNDDPDGDTQQLHQVWVEMDSVNYSVYEHGDELPLICINVKEIESVAPSPIEPEGHVFDLVTQQTTHRFTTTDTESRVKWIAAIEEILTKQQEQPSNNNNCNDQKSAGGIGLSINTDASVTASSINSSTAAAVVAASTREFESVDIDPAILDFDDEAQDVALTKFRGLFIKTQMVSFLSSTTENNGYESYLKSVGTNLLDKLSKVSSEKSIVSILCHSGLTIDILLNEICNMKSPKDLIESSINSEKKRFEKREERKNRKRQQALNQQTNKSGSGGSATSNSKSVGVSPSSSSSNSSAGFNSKGNDNKEKEKEKEKDKSASKWSMPFGKIDEKRTNSNSATENPSSNLIVDPSTKSIIGKNSEEEYQKYEKQNIHIRQVINSFRSCDAELNKCLVQNRMELASKIVYIYQELKKMNKPVEHITLDMAFVQNELKALGVKLDDSKSKCPVGFIRDLEEKRKLDYSPSLWFDSIWTLLGLQCDCDRDITFNKHSVMESVCDNKAHSPLHSEIGEGKAAASTASASESVQPVASVEVKPVKPKKAAQILLEYTDYNKSIREVFAQLLINQLEISKSNSNREHLLPILNVMIGSIYYELKDIDKCFECFSSGYNLNNQSFVMSLLVEKLSTIFSSSSSPTTDLQVASSPSTVVPELLQFLNWAAKKSMPIGLQAYKLVMSILNQINQKTLNEMRDALEGRDLLSLEVRRTLPNLSKGLELRKTSQYLSEMHLSSNRRGVFSAPAKDFEWIPNPNPVEILNEQFICQKLLVALNPCDFSIKMLEQLREILKTHCKTQKSDLQLPENTRERMKNMIAVKILPGLFDELIYSSAMRRFYIQCSKFQKVDLNELNQDQLVLFFGNVYNIITIHSLIYRGSPGNNNLDRTAFMKASQYNIGGRAYSLMDIEHCILRHASTIPMVLGPLTHLVQFDNSDERRKFLITEPRPEITFCLFTASVSSPALQVLRDADNINLEMKKYARQYFTNHMDVDIANKVIQFPGLLYQFWADFGGKEPKTSKSKGLIKITKMMNGGPEKMYNDLVEICKNADLIKQVKINFSLLDPTAAILLDK